MSKGEWWEKVSLDEKGKPYEGEVCEGMRWFGGVS